MLTQLPIRDREEAVKLGNKLLERKFIRHVSDPSKPFKDAEQFYYFTVKNDAHNDIDQ
jgi:hypothetical protein